MIRDSVHISVLRTSCVLIIALYRATTVFADTEQIESIPKPIPIHYFCKNWNATGTKCQCVKKKLKHWCYQRKWATEAVMKKMLAESSSNYYGNEVPYLWNAHWETNGYILFQKDKRVVFIFEHVWCVVIKAIFRIKTFFECPFHTKYS